MGKFYIPKRGIVLVLCFLGLFNAYSMRVNVSVALVAMVVHIEPEMANNTGGGVECPALIATNQSAEETLKGERYNWDASLQGYILSAFFYGYFLSMLPGGYFAKKIGAVRLFGLCILSTALLTLLSPLAVMWGVIPFIVLRFLEGLGQGATYPCVVCIISQWSPPLERSRMSSIICTGATMGNVFSFAVSGLLCSSDFLGGWPSVFYVFGILGCVWYVFWVIFIYDTPRVHPSISQEECSKFEDISYAPVKNRKTPWKKIATSVPFMAAIVTSLGHMFGYIVMNTEIPTYLNSVLHFNIKSSGSLSALPNVAESLGGWVTPFIADKLIASKKFTNTTIRKTFNSIAGFGPCVCLLAVAFSECRYILIMSLLTFGLFLNGSKYSGIMTAIVDMSPEHAGVLYGICNGISNISGVIAPTMVGAILSTGGTIANWSKIYLITSGVYFFTTVAFMIFGSSEPQKWDDDPEEQIPFQEKKVLKE